MGYAKYVGRVGALALALGIGTAVATPAWAESPNSNESTAAESKSPQKPLQRRGGTAPDSSAPADDRSDTAGTSDSSGTSDADDSAGSDNESADVETELDDIDELVDEPDEVLVEEFDESTGARPESSSTDVEAGAETPSETAEATASTSPDPEPTPPADAAGNHNDGDGDGDGDDEASAVAYAVTGATPPAVVPAPTYLVPQPKTPVGVILGGPVALLDIAAKAINMLFNPDPTLPGDSPILLGVLAFVRREIQRTFFNSSPTAADDTATTTETVPTRITVLDNDTDPNPGDILTITSHTQAANGAVTLNPDGSFTYTPNTGFSGTDTFTYTLSDEASAWHVHGLASLLKGHKSIATVTITVTAAPVNESPSATDDSAITAEDAVVVIDAVANDADPDGDDISISDVGTPAHGTVAILDGKITYTPEPDFHGTDSFTYTITDGSLTDTATVTVTVTPVNDAPVAVSDTVTVAGNSSGNAINVLGNDTDPDTTDSLTVTVLGAPSQGGTVAINPDKTIAYTPATGFSGTETFTYTVSDGTAVSVGTVTVTVTPVVPVNKPPVAKDDTFTMPPGAASATVNVVANDTDADGDTLSVTAVTGATNGATSFAGGTITYTPTEGFAGAEVLTYTVSDGTATTTATLTITVPAVTPINQAPIAVDDTATTVEATPVVIAVLANDTDPDGDTLTITEVSIPNHGAANIADGTITYIPAAGFSGTDTFTYTVTDGVLTSTSTVAVSVLELPPTSSEVTPVGLVTTVEAAGLSGIYGIAGAPDGSLFVTAIDTDGNFILGRVATDGTVTKLVDLPGMSIGIEIGPDGRVYIAGLTSKTVTAFDPDSFESEQVAEFDGYTVGLAFDTIGNLYVSTARVDETTSDTTDSSLVIIRTNGSRETIGIQGLSPDVHVGADGQVYASYVSGSNPSADDFVAGVLTVNSDGTFELTPLPGFGILYGVQSGPDGTLFIGDSNNSLNILYPNGITRALYLGTPTYGMTFGRDGWLNIASPTTNVITKLQPVYNPTNSHAPVILHSEWEDSDEGGQSGFVTAEDADGDVLTYTVVSDIDPAIGTVEIEWAQHVDQSTTAGVWRFTPTRQARIDAWAARNDSDAENLTVTFTIAVSDGELSDEISVTVEISPYEPFQLSDPAYTVYFDTETGTFTGTVNVIADDSYGVRYVLRDTPSSASGQVVVDSSTGSWDFTPSTAALVAAYSNAAPVVAEFTIEVTDGRTTIPVRVPVSVPVPVSADALVGLLAQDGSRPSGVAVAADGTVYIINSGANTLSVLSSDRSAIASTIHVGASPSAVSVAPDGRVWVANGADGTVMVLDRTGTVVLTTIDVGSAPTALTHGLEGAVYVANAGDGTVSVIDSTTDQLERTITVGGTPISIAAGPDGRIYIADFSGSVVTVVNPAHADAALTSIDTADANPFGIAVAADGTVYVTHPLDGTVRVLTPSAGGYIARTLTVGAVPSAIALGVDGFIYVIDQETNAVTAIDPRTFATTVITTGIEPNGIAVGPNGDLYVTTGTSNTLDIITVQDFSRASVPVEVSPNTVEIDAYGNISVTNNYDNTVSVIIHPTTGTATSAAWLPAHLSTTTGTVIAGEPINVTATATGYTLTNWAINRVISSPDSQYAYFDSYEGWVTAIHLATGTGATFAGWRTESIVLISPDGSYAYLQNDDGDVLVINPASGTGLTFDAGLVDIKRLHVSPDGSYALIMNLWNDMLMIDAASGTATTFRFQQPVYTLFGDMAISPDSRYAYVRTDYEILLVDTASGTAATIEDPDLVGSYTVGGSWKTMAMISPDSRYAYVASSGGVMVINPTTGTHTKIPTDSYPGRIVVSPDSRYAYALLDNGGVTVINPTAGTAVTIPTIGNRWDTSLVISPDSRYAYIASPGGVTVINPTTGTHSRITEYSGSVVVSPDSRYAYVRSPEGVIVFNQTTGTHTKIPTDSYPGRIVVSPDSRYAYAVSGNGVTVINPTTGTALTIPTGSKPFSLVVSPDGPDSRYASRYAYVRLENGSVIVINPIAGTHTTISNTYHRFPWAVEISPDGHWAYVNTQWGVKVFNPFSDSADVIYLPDSAGSASDLQSYVLSVQDSRYAIVIARWNGGWNEGAAIVDPVRGVTVKLPGEDNARQWTLVSPDARYVYSFVADRPAGISGTLHVIDVEKTLFPEGVIAPSYGTYTTVDTSIAFDPTEDALGGSYHTHPDSTVIAISAPSNGTAVLNGSEITYTPNAGYIGKDSFTYTAAYGPNTETSTISIDVRPKYDPPVYESYDRGPTGMEDLYTRLREAMDGKNGKSLTHGIYTEHVVVDGQKALIVYIAGTKERWFEGDQSKIRNLSSALGIVDWDQVDVITAAMTSPTEPILLVGYSQGGMDAQNIAFNARVLGLNLKDQIKAVVTFGSPVIQYTGYGYPTVHLRDLLDPVPAMVPPVGASLLPNIFTLFKRDVYIATSTNTFDWGVITNLGTIGVHGELNTYQEIGRQFDFDKSSHWNKLRKALSAFLDGRIAS